MPVSLNEEVMLTLKGQNLSKPALEEMFTQLKAIRTVVRGVATDFGVASTAMGKFADMAGKVDTALLRLPGRISDVSAVARSQKDTIDALTTSYSRLALQQRNTGGGPVTTGTGSGTSSGDRGGRGGIFSGVGQNLVQGAVFGGIYGAYSAVSGGVGQALNFNATAASTAATTGISASALRQVTNGILQIAGSGKSRYDAPTLLQGAYAIISTGVTNPQQVLSQLQAASASATAANATDVLPSTSALTTVMNAYGATTGAMKFQDIISMAINQGKADPTQVPQAFATFARSAKTAGVSLSDAAGAFAFDTLSSRDAQTSGQDINAFMRLVNNPDQASRTLAKKIPGLDWGTGMVGRAGGLDKFVQNVLARTAGSNQGLLLSGLFNNANALATIEGISADPGKFSSYLANAAGTGKTAAGAQTFLASDAGKLYGAENELKTAFQRFSDQAIPLLTQALQGLTTGMAGLGHFGDQLGKLGNFLNPPTSSSQQAETRAQLATFHQVQTSLYGPNGAFPEGPRSAAAQAYANYRNAAIASGKTVMSPQAFAAAHPAGPSFLDSIGSGVSNLLSGGQGSGNLFDLASTGTAIRNALGISVNQPIVGGERNASAGAAGQYSLMHPAGLGSDNGVNAYNRALAAAPSGAGGGAFGLGSAVAGISGSVNTGLQASAVAYQKRTAGQKKTGDMTSAQNALNLALALGASPGAIQSALNGYIAAVRSSGLDASTTAYDIYQAQQSVAAYNQNLAATAANTAATQTQAGYSHVQAVLSNAQYSGTGVAAATSGEISFLKAHPTLWGGDPAILQSMINSIHGAAGGTGAIPKAVTQNLIRPNLPYDQLTAGFGASVARLTGGPSGRDDLVRRLEQTIAQQARMIAILEKSQGSDAKTAAATAATAQGVNKLVATASKPAARTAANFHGRPSR